MITDFFLCNISVIIKVYFFKGYQGFYFKLFLKSKPLRSSEKLCLCFHLEIEIYIFFKFMLINFKLI